MLCGINIWVFVRLNRPNGCLGITLGFRPLAYGTSFAEYSHVTHASSNLRYADDFLSWPLSIIPHSKSCWLASNTTSSLLCPRSILLIYPRRVFTSRTPSPAPFGSASLLDSAPHFCYPVTGFFRTVNSRHSRQSQFASGSKLGAQLSQSGSYYPFLGGKLLSTGTPPTPSAIWQRCAVERV